MSQKEELPYQFRKVPRMNKKGVTLIVTTSPIPTHPSTSLVDTALESVLKMNYPFAEVIVSYDMPPRGEKASYREYKKIMKKKYPQFTHLPMKKHGHFIGSFYNALAHTQTEHFFMLQHDIKLAKEFPIEKCLKYTFDWNIIATHHLKDGLKETHWFPIFEQKNKDLWKVWGWSERIFLSKRDWMMDKIYHYYTSGDTRNFIEKVFHNKFKELWQKQSGLKGYREFARHKITRDEMKEYNKFWNEWKCFALKSNVAYHVHLFGRTAKTKKRGGGPKGKTKDKTRKLVRKKYKNISAIDCAKKNPKSRDKTLKCLEQKQKDFKSLQKEYAQEMKLLKKEMEDYEKNMIAFVKESDGCKKHAPDMDKIKKCIMELTTKHKSIFEDKDMSKLYTDDMRDKLHRLVDHTQKVNLGELGGMVKKMKAGLESSGAPPRSKRTVKKGAGGKWAWKPSDAKIKKKDKCCRCHYYRTKSGQLRKLRGPWGHCSYDMANCCKDKKTIEKTK